MDWEILLKYLPMYEKAAWLTIQIGFMGIAGATVLGLICAVIQYERILFFRQITAMYIELSRNTPLLVQLFFLNDQDDKSDIDGAKGNETLLNWINEEIQSLKEEQFFHKDYDETLVATYGEEYKEELVVEGAKIK